MIGTFDPLDKAFIEAAFIDGNAMSSGAAHAAMRAFMESPAFIDHLADALHADSDSWRSAIGEFECYCRRIATADGTKDGPQDDNWDTTKPYDPADWGVADPPLCEQSAAAIVSRMLHR